MVNSKSLSETAQSLYYSRIGNAYKDHLALELYLEYANTPPHELTIIWSVDDCLIYRAEKSSNDNVVSGLSMPMDSFDKLLSWHDVFEAELLVNFLALQGVFKKGEETFARAFIQSPIMYQSKSILSTAINPKGGDLHRFRSEILTCMNEGGVIIVIEDFYGKRKTMELNFGDSILIRPFIKHWHYAKPGVIGIIRAMANANRDIYNPIAKGALYINDGSVGLLEGKLREVISIN